MPATFTWTSGNPAVATVTQTGVVTGHLVSDHIKIIASTGGQSATALVAVAPQLVSNGTINVNGAQQFQTMTGWEALQEIGQAECDPRAYQTYRLPLLDRAANEIGVNRIRLGLRNGYENPVDYFTQFKSGLLTFNDWKTHWFQVVNDNADPFVINPAGFNWGYLDYTIEQLVLPLKQRLLARGDNLWLNMSYTGANSGILHRNAPEEYAEFVLAAFQHMQQKYGLVPNSLELVNEPNLGGWTAQQIGANLVAAKRRLNQFGFFPDFVGPSNSSLYATLLYFGQMITMPGVSSALNEISYHRFGATDLVYLQQVAQYGLQHRMRTAMLEWGYANYTTLHEDLTIANVSAWQQFGLAFCSDFDSNGGTYFWISGALPGQNSPVVNTGRQTKLIRQYFRYVPLRSVRVGATSTDARFAPIAFRTPTGRFTVVVKASVGGGFSIGGLPQGTYGIDYTTGVEYARALPDVTILSGQTMSTSIPAAGVLTVYGK